MSVFEAIGSGFVILMCCIGIYTVGVFVIAGIRHSARLIDLGGRAMKDPQMCDLLNSENERREQR